ncbi:sarcosine oxidase subunit gamma family protein [Sandarakinorhabdus sp. DWP1-3-1]|uniref:sarcosine oxidase subunit gamma family protein n=1 Tax=Sandarakinorhabdus sp. DWP1-3-1 TaxID=2804627 RepID=UPI003CEE11F1
MVEPPFVTAPGLAVGRADPGAAHLLRRRDGGDGPGYRLAPGEYLQLDAAPPALPPGTTAHVADLTHALIGFTITGRGAADLLAKGTGLDLHPHRLPVGTATRTLFAQVDIVIVAGAEGFRILAEPGYAAHLAAWFIDAAIEFNSGHSMA